MVNKAALTKSIKEIALIEEGANKDRKYRNDAKV
jgi:hypothetical protein